MGKEPKFGMFAGPQKVAEMVSILPFLPRPRSSAASSLICFVDLQVEYVASSRRLALADREPWTSNCRSLMVAARQNKLSIAHFRQVRRETEFNSASDFSDWIDDFRPRPFEMVFERSKPSCYTAAKFCDLLNSLDNPEFLLVGLTVEGACLSTAVEAFHRGDRCIFVADASASLGLGDLSEVQSHQVATDLVRSYCGVTTTSEALAWITGPNRERPRGGVNNKRK